MEQQPLWPFEVEVKWIDKTEAPQENINLDVELGEAIGRGEVPPLIRIWRAGSATGIGVSKKDIAASRGIEAKDALERQGFTVVVRQTGGTAVPQGDGVVHVSYLFPRPKAHVTTDAYYRLLCRPLQDWLALYGLDAETGALEGSYCDGTYNILLGKQKLVGTAQAWKGGLAGLSTSRPGYVIAHACMTIDVDMEFFRSIINQFYALSGSDYRVAHGTSVTLRERAPHLFHGSARQAADDAAVALVDYYQKLLLSRQQ